MRDAFALAGHSQNNGRVRADAAEETCVVESRGRYDKRSRAPAPSSSLESTSYRGDSLADSQRGSSGK